MINKQIKMAQALGADELYSYAKELRVPVDLLQKTAELGRLPVVNFAAGGIGRLRACSQCSAPKHLTFNPTFPRKQKLFSREGKDLVILPLLQEICKDKMKDLLC